MKQQPDDPRDAHMGWGRAMGVQLYLTTKDQVILRLEVGERHLQPMGIVHGGVYSGLVETACSVGAFLAAQAHGLLIVGVDNQTSFLRAVRSGVLTTTAHPVSAGRRTALWRAEICDEQDEVVSVGQLRLLTVEPGASLAGEQARIKYLPEPPAGD